MNEIQDKQTLEIRSGETGFIVLAGDTFDNPMVRQFWAFETPEKVAEFIAKRLGSSKPKAAILPKDSYVLPSGVILK